MNELASYLVSRGTLRTGRIIRAFEKVDRRGFVADEHRAGPYGDHPLPIGHGQTISQPFTVAFMLELLSPREGDRVLDVGSGSGWTVALLSEIVGQKGFVFGTEKVPALVEFGRDNVRKAGVANAEIVQAGKELGLKEKGPFDRILVSAAAAELPSELVAQLKAGGIMVIPVGRAILKVTKDSKGKIRTERFEGFAFVPLV
jgi:protein-L-isoaspartate(D-aspartate) O-methyltransferase